MFASAGLQPGDVVLDLGSGGGNVLLHAHAKGYKAVGIEIQRDEVERAQCHASYFDWLDKIHMVIGMTYARSYDSISNVM